MPDNISAQATFNVVEVKIEGNHIAKESLIMSVAGIRPGEQLTATKTQDAIKHLFKLGFFEDVTLLAEEAIGGLSITIKVKELPKLVSLKIEGNEEIKEKDFVEELHLVKNSYLSKFLVNESENKILEMYGKKGYFFAKVDHDFKYGDDSTTADLVFKIDEGSKVKVEKVVLTGAVRVEADKIISKMRNRKRGFLRSSDYDREKYEEDKDKVIGYLHNEGYIDAYLKSDSISIDTSRNRMTVYFDIYEGPRYYFGASTFSGNEVLPEKLLNKVMKHNEGDIFSYEKFDESLYELYFAYQEKGHLHVRIIDDRKTHDSLININFDIIEGLPSEVNFVRIIGNTKTREKVIRREMMLRPGQVFHRSLLIRSIRDIMALNYFGNVEPDIVDLPSGDIDVIVRVEEKPTAQISAGAGYSGVDKFVGTFGLGIPNFRGMGQNLSTNVDIGSETSSYSVSFTDPWAFNTPTSVGGDIYITHREWYSDYKEGRRGGSVRLGRRLRWPDNYFRIYANYRLEQDRFYDFSSSYRLSYSDRTITYDTLYTPDDDFPAIPDTSVTITAVAGEPLARSLLTYEEEWLTASSLQLSLIRDSRDLPEFSTKGSIFSYALKTVGGPLGGYWKYQKHSVSFSKFIPLFWNFVLANKVTYGAIHSPSGTDRVLESDKFSPGGTGYSGIVRGYDDGSLTSDETYAFNDSTIVIIRDNFTNSPDTIITMDTSVSVNDGTRSIRSNYMLVGNMELQYPLIQNQLYGLAFFDIGNSWLNTAAMQDHFKLYKGVGLGFRLVVPGIGTIGFDFGYALDEKNDQEKGWKAHFQIGTVFR